MAVFDSSKYENILQANELLPSDYENMMRGAMMRDALQQMVNQGVQVSDADAQPCL